MGILKAIFKVFGINSGAVESTPNPRLITNELLLNELANVFATRLKEESVRQRMLFPMCFNVLMHKDDYYNRKDALAMVLPEVVAEFYSIIKKNLSRKYFLTVKRDGEGRPKGFGEPTLTHGILRFSHFLDLWEQCALLPCGERAFLLY